METDRGQVVCVEVGDFRGLLFSVAYRMLGSAHDAEDMVQEAFSRWYAQTPENRSEIGSPRAWLVAVTSRACLDHLRSARARHEAYVGDWLPEPIPPHRMPVALDDSSAPGDPADHITLSESVSTALLVLLEELTPAQRVAFVLHDVFRLPFSEVSEILERSPEACRQLAVAARRHVRGESDGQSVDTELHSEVVSAFKLACITGNLQALITSLAPDVVVRVDGGGRVRAALNPIMGQDKVARFVLGVLAKQHPVELSQQTVNGMNGIVKSAHDRVTGVYAFKVDAGKISRIWIVVNPDKLSAWNT